MAPTRWLFLFACLAVFSVATATPAAAGKPEFVTVQVNNSDFYASCDDFDLILSASGTIKSSFRASNNGGAVIIDRYRLVDTWTNSVTGKSISSPDVGIDKLTISPDGSATRAVIGLFNRLAVPGQGLVTIDAGRVVLYYTGPFDEPDVIFEAGQHTDELYVQTLCSLLAP